MHKLLFGILQTIKLAPVDDDGAGGGSDDNTQPDDTGDDDDDDTGDDDDDDTGDDDDDDTGDDDDDDTGDDDDDDTGDDDDDEGVKRDFGKGAQKRIRKLVDEKNALKKRVAQLEAISGDDGKAILAAAEASGILPGLMTKAEAEAFDRMSNIPSVIEHYEDWIDEHGEDDSLELPNGNSMNYGQVKTRVRRLRKELEDLKDKYGERRKALKDKVRSIFETGVAALEAGWKPEGKKPAKKLKPKAHDRPSGKTKKPLAKSGGKANWGDVDGSESLVRMIASQKDD